MIQTEQADEQITSQVGVPPLAEEVQSKPARCKAGFVVCFNKAVESCLMCGRNFCSEHGKVEQGVCRHCRHEYADKLRVEAASYQETVRREVAEARNGVGLCGVEGCENAHIVMCERCGQNYCARHWGRYNYRQHYRTRTGVKSRRVQVILCGTCKHSMRY